MFAFWLSTLFALRNLFDQNNHGYNKDMNHNSDAHDAYKFKVKKHNINQRLKG